MDDDESTMDASGLETRGQDEVRTNDVAKMTY